MTKILLLTDIHGQFEIVPAFLELGPDLVIIAGDLTDCGAPEDARKVLDMIDVPCFAIPGNCDRKEIINIIEESDAVNLHGTSLEIGSITLTGVGGSNPTPFGTPFELSEEEIDKLLQEAMARGGRNIHNILVVHAPPHGTLDEVGGANVGCRSIRKYLKDFDLVCCGHIHDQTGVVKEEGTVIVNPGPASEGKCAVIILGEEAKDIQVDLIQL